MRIVFIVHEAKECSRDVCGGRTRTVERIAYLRSRCSAQDRLSVLPLPLPPSPSPSRIHLHGELVRSLYLPTTRSRAQIFRETSAEFVRAFHSSRTISRNCLDCSLLNAARSAQVAAVADPPLRSARRLDSDRGIPRSILD